MSKPVILVSFDLEQDLGSEQRKVLKALAPEIIRGLESNFAVFEARVCADDFVPPTAWLDTHSLLFNGLAIIRLFRVHTKTEFDLRDVQTPQPCSVPVLVATLDFPGAKEFGPVTIKTASAHQVFHLRAERVDVAEIVGVLKEFFTDRLATLPVR